MTAQELSLWLPDKPILPAVCIYCGLEFNIGVLAIANADKSVVRKIIDAIGTLVYSNCKPFQAKG